MKKFELTNETKTVNGITFHRIKALKDFNNVKKGDLGGWVEKTENLSLRGNCWIYENARVSGTGYISENACVSGDAWISGDAWVHGNAIISENAEINGFANVYENAIICGNAWVSGCAEVHGNANVHGNAILDGMADIKTNKDIVTLKRLGFKNKTSTIFMCKDGKSRIRHGLFL